MLAIVVAYVLGRRSGGGSSEDSVEENSWRSSENRPELLRRHDIRRVGNPGIGVRTDSRSKLQSRLMAGSRRLRHGDQNDGRLRVFSCALHSALRALFSVFSVVAETWCHHREH